jgi:hypothetical protein
MEGIQMKSGLAIPDEPSDNIKTFILVFMAIIWRRVWITTAIYCEHNKINLHSSVVLKALKYNIFSEAGIGHTLQPYIVKALTDGFLMPKFYENNIYATRAVKLYKKGYEIVKTKNRQKEIQFLKDYAMSVFKTDSDVVTDVTEETKDTLKQVEIKQDNFNDSGCFSDTTSGNLSDTSETEPEGIIDLITSPEKCKCKLCELVDSWDVNLDLIYSDDPFQNVVMKGLMTTLENSDC